MRIVKRLLASPVIFCGAAGFIIGALALLVWIPRSAFPLLGVCTAFIGAISAILVEPIIQDRPPGTPRLLLGALVGALVGCGIPLAGLVILLVIGALFLLFPYALPVLLMLLYKVFTPAFFEGLALWPVVGALSGLVVGARERGRPLPESSGLLALALCVGLLLLTPWKSPANAGAIAPQDDVEENPFVTREKARVAAQLAAELQVRTSLSRLAADPGRLQYPRGTMVLSGHPSWHLTQDTHDPARVVRKYYEHNLGALFSPSQSSRDASPEGTVAYSGRKLAIELLVDKQRNETQINVFMADPHSP